MSSQVRSGQHSHRRWLPARVLACIAIASGVALAPATVAVAGGPGNYYSDHYKNTDDGDRGGSSGSVTVHPADETRPMYAIQFQAKGENVYVKDFSNLKSGLVARVYVYDKSGEIIDADSFRTKASDTAYNLGTPDGSGNIPEGYKVSIQVESVDSGYYSDWGYFTA